MNKIVLTGENVTKSELVDTIRSINSNEMDVEVIDYSINVRLKKRNSNESEESKMIVNWLGKPTNKLKCVKVIKNLTGLGLKESKDLLDDHILQFGPGEYEIRNFIEVFLKDQITTEQLMSFYEGYPADSQEFFEITVK